MTDSDPGTDNRDRPDMSLFVVYHEGYLRGYAAALEALDRTFTPPAGFTDPLDDDDLPGFLGTTPGGTPIQEF